MIPVTPWIVVGIMGDLSGGKTTASSTQSFFYPSDPSILHQVTSETYTSSVSQSTSGSIRFKAGLVTPLAGWYSSIMPYITVGWVRSKIEGTFTYNATNFNTFLCCSQTFAGTSASWSHQTNGVVYGFGVDIPIPAVGPGVVLALDYSRADFQSFDVTVPVTAAPCFPGPGRVCATTDTLHISNPSSNRFTAGIRVKFL
jgi:opacity protein-like surface antigen